MKNSLKHYVKLARPANIGLVTFVVLITSALFEPFPPVLRVLLAIICVVFITAGGNALNDIYDVEIDRINKPKRPLPAGLISIAGARGFMVAMFVFGNLAALFLGLWPFVISVLIVTPLLYWYARHLRNVALVGNIIVAFLSSMTFLFAAVAFGDISAGYVPAIYCFMLSLIREIVKDLEDLDGDKANDSNTLPVSIGENSTRVLVAIMILFFLPFLPLPYVAGLYGKWFFFIAFVGVGIPLIIMMIQLFQLKRKINYYQIASVMKIVMFIGILAIFLGKF
ncbi:MAG: geranylgeranylglycerol-phosphate geranylgeranyltransferase [Candidatus Marinimicrobia bacterium]|nr:geranylgeranylglycerol-phosphate geranylgeranyltransferase [Candidatus Neomarinimicrobiota bacterium]